MGHVVTPPALSGQHRSPAPVRPATLDERLALRWGCAPATAHRIRCGDHSPLDRVVDEVEERLAVGDVAGVMTFLAPILQRINVADALPSVDELARAKRLADIDEDRAFEEWRQQPDAPHRQRWLRARSVEQFHGERLAAAASREAR